MGSGRRWETLLRSGVAHVIEQHPVDLFDLTLCAKFVGNGLGWVQPAPGDRQCKRCSDLDKGATPWKPKTLGVAAPQGGGK